jgi:hypothetical protein
MGRGRGVLLVEIHVGEGELLVEIDGEGRGCKLLLQILGEGELKWTGGRLLCSSWLCVRAEERRKGREGREEGGRQIQRRRKEGGGERGRKVGVRTCRSLFYYKTLNKTLKVELCTVYHFESCSR